MIAEKEKIVNIISDEYFDIFRELMTKYPTYRCAIITDFLIPFSEGEYSIEQTLEDFSEQPGVNKEHVMGLLERIKKNS